LVCHCWKFVYQYTCKKLEEDDYHYQDLIGKKVYKDDGVLIGKVTSMIEVPQGHLMEVEKTDQKKVLIPFVQAFIGDINQDRIIIHPIEGLL
jgi:16S rRNA processing protein RimM